MTEVRLIIKDLEILCESTERDQGSTINYRRASDHITRFNELLARAQELGYGSDINMISPETFRTSRLDPDVITEAMAKISDVNSEARRLLSRLKEDQAELANAYSSEATIERIASHFHNVVRQLRSRHDGRETLYVKDEYDVQDLMHALLRLFFDDIRTEEWTPSYAGGAARMDFLLKNEEIVIETKMARDTLTSKKLGEELIVDIEKYAQHPNCRTLFCLVYDPMGLIPNPRGIEADLMREDKGLPVIVSITPS